MAVGDYHTAFHALTSNTEQQVFAPTGTTKYLILGVVKSRVGSLLRLYIKSGSPSVESVLPDGEERHTIVDATHPLYTQRNISSTVFIYVSALEVA